MPAVGGGTSEPPVRNWPSRLAVRIRPETVVPHRLEESRHVRGAPEAAPGGVSRAAPADADVPVNPPAAPPSSGHQSDSVTSPGAGSSAPAPATGSPSRTRKWPRRDPRTAGSRSSRHREHRRIGERRRPAPAADEVASSWRDGCGSCQACCRASPPQGLPVPWWPPLTGKCAVNINFKY